MERELMDFMLPKSRVMEASFLKRERMVDQAVWGSPSMRLSLAKKGGSSLEAATERGMSFWGSSQEETSSGMVLVVVMFGTVDDVVGGIVVDPGRLVVAMVLVFGTEVVPGAVVVAGGTVVVMVVVPACSSASPSTSADFALSLPEVS